VTAVEPAANEAPVVGRPDFITHEQMHEYRERNLARPLSRIMTDFTRYDEQWWIADQHGWYLIDDVQLVARLDNHAAWAEGDLYQ
jgi:hypothetical protein